MKTPQAIKPSTRAASKRLLALGLSVLALPALLSAQTLQHRYSFVSDASDSVGGANGTVVAPGAGVPCTIANGLQLPGGGNPGYSGYVTLPAGILAGDTNITIECWVTQNNPNQWACIYDFNNDQNHRMGFCPNPNRNNGNPIMEVTPSGGEVDVNSSVSFPSGVETYVAYTYNDANLVGNLYTNGVMVGSVTFPNNTYSPGRIGGASGTAHNQFGQDPYPDPQFQGTIFEFRVWNGVVPQRYLQASALMGSSVVVNNLTPTSVALTAGPSVIVSGTLQAQVTVRLPQTGTADLLATLDATNWTSSNPNVLQVNQKGVIVGVNTGTATVSCKVAGVSATSGTISVTGPQQLIHRYSFVSDASDSVGTANGTLQPAGDPNGTAATINNGLTLPGGGGGKYSGYLSLPSDVLAGTSSLTIECWLSQSSSNTWAEAWDFANSTAQNFAFIPRPGENANNMEAVITQNGASITSPSSLLFPNNTEQHVTFTYDNYNLSGKLYLNGVLVGTGTYPNTTYDPSTFTATGPTNNVLGPDIWNDSQFQGKFYEFRIWNGAVSAAYAAASAVAGPSVIITNVVPTALSLTVSSTSMIGAGTQQATLMGDLRQVSGVTLTGAATNWVSSNPNILTVSSSGLITAVNGGSATVSATVSGVTATSPSITVASTPPSFLQKPAAVTRAIGETATFTAVALGGSLNYQWSKGATTLTGATNSTLTLTNLALSDSGTYTVQVSNNLGSTNASATLTVQQAILLHRYSFVTDATDSVGTANGTLVAPGSGSPATIANGLTLPGGGGGGFSGYLALPAGILTNTASLTVECWVTQNSPQEWATVWDFANDGNHNFELCPFPQRGILNLAVAVTPNGNEVDSVTGALFPSGTEQYVSFTFDAQSLTSHIYTNGLLGSTTVYPNSTYIPGTIGGANGTSQNWLGNNTYGDAQFQGTVYEFRIWDGAVSPVYLAIQNAVGPNVVVTNLTPNSVGVTVGNTTMTGGTTQQATATGLFQALPSTPITINGAITNWTSSNIGVLTVNSSGLISAVGVGSATISATYNGITGTSPSITVPALQPTITTNPPATETLLVGATLKASVSVIGTAPFTYFWFTNSSTVPISVSTSPTLVIPNIQLGANGNTYTCLVSNSVGTATSTSLGLTVVVPTQYEQALLQYRPLAYWPLNEGSGTVAYDLASGNNGTYVGSAAWTAGPANPFFGPNSVAAQFDALTTYVDIPEGPFNITNAITISVWFQMTASHGFDGIVGHGDQSWRISVDDNGHPGANDGSAPSDAAAAGVNINDNNWHNLVYTYNGFVGTGNNGALYVDGVLQANNEIDVPPSGDNLDVWIGGSPDYGTARLVWGNIANVSIYPYSFTSAQVTGLFNGNYVASPTALTVTNTPAGPKLTWSQGVLLQAPTLFGPWTTNYSAVPPYTAPVGSGNQFFRLLINP